MEDNKLIMLMRENPSEGLRAAIDIYSPVVTAIVKRVLYGNAQDLEECVADTFVKFWETAQTLDPESSCVKAYLICIARNLAINRYHYLKRRHAISLENTFDGLPDTSDLESEVLQSESIEILLEAVESLPGPNRELLIRRYFLFEPVKKIAQELGLTDSVVSNRIQYSKLQLRKSLVMRGVSL